MSLLLRQASGTHSHIHITSTTLLSWPFAITWISSSTGNSRPTRARGVLSQEWTIQQPSCVTHRLTVSFYILNFIIIEENIAQWKSVHHDAFTSSSRIIRRTRVVTHCSYDFWERMEATWLVPAGGTGPYTCTTHSLDSWPESYWTPIQLTSLQVED